MTGDIEILEALVLRHDEVAPEHFVITLQAPQIARDARPGQFVMLRSLGTWDPLLPRAYSVFEVDAEAGSIGILYREVGRGTRRLRLNEPGTRVHTWGPLGNRFSGPDAESVVLVGGGVGIPPLVFWAAHFLGSPATRTESCTAVALVGASTRDFLVGLDAVRRAGVDVRTATDDGSAGHHGFVTELLPPLLDGQRTRVYACGPMPMLAAVARISEAHGAASELALEAPMACGVGACIGCTVPRREGGYARVCTDGPVFAAEAIAW